MQGSTWLSYRHAMKSINRRIFPNQNKRYIYIRPQNIWVSLTILQLYNLQNEHSLWSLLMFLYGCIKEKPLVKYNRYITWHKFIEMILKRNEGTKTKLVVGKIQHKILSVITKRLYIQIQLIYIWPLWFNLFYSHGFQKTTNKCFHGWQECGCGAITGIFLTGISVKCCQWREIFISYDLLCKVCF